MIKAIAFFVRDNAYCTNKQNLPFYREKKTKKNKILPNENEILV